MLSSTNPPSNESFSSNSSLHSDLNMTPLSTFKYYDTSYRIVGTLVMTVIFLLGVIGNSMVILVVMKSKSMRSPTNCYLVSLAFADLLLLISATLPTIVEFHLVQDRFVAGSFACRIMVFLQYLGFNLSSLSITALTAERYVAICKPMKAHVICTINRAKKIIGALWLFGLCYSAPWLGLITTKERQKNFEECTFTLSREQYMIYYLTDLVVMYLFPVVLNIFLYTLISKTLYYNNPISSALNNSGVNTSGMEIARNNEFYDNGSKFGSYKSSSINSSFRSDKNNENRSLIRKKFANESIKSFTLNRHESRERKSIKSFRKKFWKRGNSMVTKGNDSFDSYRICERVEDEEENSNVKKDKAIDLVKERQKKKESGKKNEKGEECGKVVNLVEDGVGGCFRNEKSSLKIQLSRQAGFHETICQAETEVDKIEKTTQGDNISSLEVDMKLTDVLTNLSQMNSSTSTVTSTTIITSTPVTAKTSNFSSYEPLFKPSRDSSTQSRRNRFISSNSTGFSLKSRGNRSFLLSSIDVQSHVDSKNKSNTLITLPPNSVHPCGNNPLQSRKQIIKMLVVVVSLFAVLWLPYRVYVLYNSFRKLRYENIWLMLACRTMVHTNSAINPVLYNAMSAKFKKAFKNLLHCGKSHPTKPPDLRNVEKCNIENYSRKEVFFNMYKKNYQEIVMQRAKSVKN